MFLKITTVYSARLRTPGGCPRWAKPCMREVWQGIFEGPRNDAAALLLQPILYRLYERYLLKEVVRRPAPRHLGLIQDGHRRYARHAGLPNQEGYRRGAAKAMEVLTWCAELKIPMVSLWWLSTENLAREPDEIAAVLSVIEEKVLEWVREGTSATPIRPYSGRLISCGQSETTNTDSGGSANRAVLTPSASALGGCTPMISLED